MRLRVRLAHKIIGVAAIGLAGLAVVASIYFIGNSSVERFQRIADESGGSGALPAQVNVHLLDIRRAEKDFLLRADEAYVKRHQEMAASIRSSFEPLKKQFRDLGEATLEQAVGALAGGFDAYMARFAALEKSRIELGLTENLGLEGKLRGAVHDIESTLAKIDNPPALAAMLMMRRHEKDFMLRRSAK